MARRLSSLIPVLILLLAGSTSLPAQQPAASEPAPPASQAPPASYDTPPAITVVDGSARLVRQGQAQAAVVSMPLVEGDRVVTDSGRVGITFPDGSLLHIDRNTTIDFLSLSLMRLRDGRVILVVAGGGGERPSVDYQIDGPSGSARVGTAGEYRFSVGSGEVELDVVTGNAALATDQGSVDLRAGERSFARNGAPPDDPQTFNSARLDDFDEWSQTQRDVNVGSQSTEYLPSELDAYASTFDHYGRWDNVEPYGYVWYPTVPVGWRPYYNGYWDDVGPYGWTWIGYDHWAWPTHHWGRWGFRAGCWFWIPSHHWGPAWVSWGIAPGYVGWCPLDYYNRAVVSLTFGYGYVYAHPLYDPWLCWTVVPHNHFGCGIHVAPHAVPGARLPATVRAGFAVSRQGPERPFAVARAGVARPRTGTMGTAVPRALSSVTMQSRPRDSVFASARAVARGASPGPTTGSAAYASPRRDSRSLAFSARPSASSDRPTAAPRAQATSRAYPGSAEPRGQASSPAYPGTAAPRASARQATPYEDRPPTASPRSRGDSAAPRQQAQPRSYSAPRDYAPPRSSEPSRGNSAPRSYSVPAPPRYSAPATPRYPAPNYSAPAVPRYSAPAAPRYSAPSSSAPSAAPRYVAPPPRGPSYSAPSGGAYAAPRSGSGPAPHSAPSGGSSRPAPSGGQQRGGRGR